MVKCDECGIENEDDAISCRNCGKKFQSKKIIKRNKKITLFVGFILGFLILIVLIFSFASLPVVDEFDSDLIKSVNSGESSDILIQHIKENSEVSRQDAKISYDNKTSTAISTNNTILLEDVEAFYYRELENIQKLENMRISFVKGEIDEETFIDQVNTIYED